TTPTHCPYTTLFRSLGRVVVPKEIGRTLRIREGDPLEIFVAREGEVILKKYSPINELSHFAEEYADALYDSIQFPVFICDRDERSEEHTSELQSRFD